MVNYVLKPKKISTSIERVFRPMSISGYNGPQIFREIHRHFIHFIDPDTGEVTGTKFDKDILGKWYKVADKNTPVSPNGESVVDYVSPDDNSSGVPTHLRLVALAEDMNGKPILR